MMVLVKESLGLFKLGIPLLVTNDLTVVHFPFHPKTFHEMDTIGRKSVLVVCLALRVQPFPKGPAIGTTLGYIAVSVFLVKFLQFGESFLPLQVILFARSIIVLDLPNKPNVVQFLFAFFVHVSPAVGLSLDGYPMLQRSIFLEGHVKIPSISFRGGNKLLIVAFPNLAAPIHLGTTKGKSNFFQLSSPFCGKSFTDGSLVLDPFSQGLGRMGQEPAIRQ